MTIKIGSEVYVDIGPNCGCFSIPGLEDSINGTTLNVTSIIVDDDGVEYITKEGWYGCNECFKLKQEPVKFVSICSEDGLVLALTENGDLYRYNSYLEKEHARWEKYCNILKEYQSNQP